MHPLFDKLGKCLGNCVAVDLEIHPESHELLKLGAIAPGRDRYLHLGGSRDASKHLHQLDAFCKQAALIVGHNISDHDIPWIKTHYPRLELLSLPLIDTLYLSPLAFPRNPYHRLVKDYKIVRESINDPTGDARLTLSLFSDQIDAFYAMKPEITGIYGYLLNKSYPKDGYDVLFRSILETDLPHKGSVPAAMRRLCEGKVCTSRADDVFTPKAIESDNAVHLAYILAWLQVAGETSVLPPWVRHRFPKISGVLDTLRASPCMDTDCSFCMTHHDPKASLERYFGFKAFLPVKEEDPPMQEQVVRTIVFGNSCLAVLPTGAGKSLCYQLPGLMKSRMRNQMTLVISPLQALMKDQVDGLTAKGVTNAGTINGLLTMLERSKTLEGIINGDIDLLWIAPEQLRNTTVKSAIMQREVGMVVVDEAHCFSKWGHDFRPDYLYISKFISKLGEHNNGRLPQVVCFTATAKKDVIKEIQAYFEMELNLSISVFEGGHERRNLNYHVERVAENEKQEIIHNILTDVFQDEGSTGGAIVFVSTRKNAERISKMLCDNGWTSDYFHGERTPDEKKMVQDRFLSGDLSVIVATNAFGMGVDKPDVRAVIHADIPGSIENYLQEAGRAGRDRNPATCVLLFNDQDLETQFRLSSYGRLEWADMSGMLTGFKKLAAKTPDKTIVLTSGEILRSDAMEEQGLIDLSSDEKGYDTRVKTAVSWLEKTGKLVRGDNRTQVVQGRILIDNMEKAVAEIGKLNLSSTTRRDWTKLLDVLFQSEPKELLNTDALSQVTGIEPHTLLSILHAMRKAGIINHDMNMTAYVHKGVADSTRKRFNSFRAIEKAVVSLMAEYAHETEDKRAVINPRKMSQTLKDREMADARPDQILMVLDLFRMEGLIRFRHQGADTYSLLFKKEWQEIISSVEERDAVNHVILDLLEDKIPFNVNRKDILVEFRSGELLTAIKFDITTRYIDKPEDRIKSCLLALHKINAISLQSGLAVFRPAMTIQVVADKNEKFSKAEFKSIDDFQKEKNIQVHVIGKYAELGLAAIDKALTLVREYFFSDRKAFLKSFFSGQMGLLELPTTTHNFQKITSDLKNPIQEKAVASSRFKNLLIIAGPGSGKTRVIVHRIAWLVKVRRIRPMNILAVAFNRSAVTQLKQRIKDLIGVEGSWIRVHTYHSLAMSITGRSLAGKTDIHSRPDLFDTILEEAVAILEAESETQEGLLEWRDRLLFGLRYILVDEYQDINDLEYRFLSLLAGRNEKSSGKKPCLMAVGDDDQNIYAWQGANVKFIRRFEADYDAELIYMTGNYRSSIPIIEASNCLISKNKDRMKKDPIVCANPDTRSKGPENKVVIVRTLNKISMLKSALEKASGLLETDGTLSPCDICILCRSNRELDIMQVMARQMKIPVKAIRQRKQPITATREFQILMETLKTCRDQIVKGEMLRSLVHGLIEQSGFSENNIWLEIFESLLQNYLVEIMDMRLPVGNFIDYIYDSSRDTRQLQQFEKERIFLSTIHVAKGLEFPAVIIAGQPVLSKDGEDERRLFYVAMTRAMERLYLFYNADQYHPFISELDDCGDQYIRHRTLNPEIDEFDVTAFNSVLWDLELKDVVISFPAYDQVHKNAQRSLEMMESGNSDGLSLKEHGERFSFYYKKYPIARLSARGSKHYKGMKENGYQIHKIIFLASLRWHADETSDYPHGMEAIKSWYTGLFQVILIKK